MGGTTRGLGGLWRSQPPLLVDLATEDRSATMPRAMAENTGSSAVNAGDASAAPESGAVRPVAPEEQTTPPEASQGMVEHAIWPSGPPSGAPTAEEEDEVEEIEREES